MRKLQAITRLNPPKKKDPQGRLQSTEYGAYFWFNQLCPNTVLHNKIKLFRHIKLLSWTARQRQNNGELLKLAKLVSDLSS